MPGLERRAERALAGVERAERALATALTDRADPWRVAELRRAVDLAKARWAECERELLPGPRLG